MKQNEQSYIAVVDVGSSRLRGCLGYRKDGEIHVVATAWRNVGEEVRRGMVCNVRSFSVLLGELLQELENNPVQPCRISEVTVSVNAGSMRSIEVKSSDSLQGTEEVTQDTLEELQIACEAKVPENKSLYFSYLQEYLLDGYRTLSPIGEKPKLLEARYKLLIGKPEIVNNLKDSFNELKTDFVMQPGVWASAVGFVSPEERNRGTIVVDFGAETTSVCVIKNNIIRHFVVLPIGGQSITNDLTGVVQLVEEAEQEKIDKGSAIHFTSWKNGLGAAGYQEGSELPSRDKEINEVIVARAEEIVENVFNQIKLSGIPYHGMTMYVFGGASQLKDLKVLLENRTGMKVVRFSHLADKVVADGTPALDDGFCQCVGMLTLANEGGCTLLEQPEPEEPKAVEQPDPAPYEELEKDPDEEGTPSIFGFFRSQFGTKKNNAKSAAGGHAPLKAEKEHTENEREREAVQEKEPKSSRRPSRKIIDSGIIGNLFESFEDQLKDS